MTRFTLPLALLALPLLLGAARIDSHCATCYGDTPCRACSNCRYCGHCAKGGGTCGVCAPSPQTRTGLPSFPQARKPARPGSAKPLPGTKKIVTVSTPAGGGVNFRLRPDNAAARLKSSPVLREGARVEVLKVGGDWLFGKAQNGRKGWLRWRYHGAIYVTPSL